MVQKKLKFFIKMGLVYNPSSLEERIDMYKLHNSDNLQFEFC